MLQDTESVVQMCKWANDTDSYEVESNECVISDYKVSQMMLRGWVEFRSLMALGKKLLLSLAVFAIRLRKRLPDGSIVKRQFPGWFVSLMILTALLLQRLR